jgi:hypothetical protein
MKIIIKTKGQYQNGQSRETGNFGHKTQNKEKEAKKCNTEIKKNPFIMIFFKLLIKLRFISHRHR